MRPFVFDGYRAYPTFIAIGIIAGIVVVALTLRRNRMPLARFMVFEAIICASGLLGARLYSLLARGVMAVPWTSTEATTLRYPGGLIAAAVVAIALRPVLLPQLSFAATADLLSPSIAIAMAIVRLGCFSAGCCFGLPSSMPWAITFPRDSPAWNAHVSHQLLSPSTASSLPIEPLQLYFAAWSSSVGIGLLWLSGRRRYDGQVALWFLATHELGKFALEFLRHDDPSQSTWHLKVVSLALGLSAAIYLVARRARHPARSDLRSVIDNV